MNTRRRRYRPNIDSLEDRLVLSTYGNAWPNPGDISISFAPDGTSDGNQPSTLFQTLNGLDQGGNDWELTMLRAFQTWATEANVNFSLSGDGGLAFGTSGAIQGDSRFGDIRIGAIAQTPVTMALTQPFSYGAGTWAGDVNLNSTQPFSLGTAAGGNSGAADLYAVALHEAGHSLGLPCNNDPTSIMYTYYQGQTAGLSASDIKAMQAIYGVAADTPNGSFAAASTIVPLTSATDSADVVDGRLATTTSADYFVLNAGTNPGPTQVELRTSGVSLLDATLTVYDASHNVLGTATAPDPRSGDLAVSLSSLAPGAKYYVSVAGANGDAFSVGSYQLSVVPGSAQGGSTGSSPAPFDDSLDVNNSFATATSLVNPSAQVSPDSYLATSTLTAAMQARYYSFTSPENNQGGPGQPAANPKVLTVSTWGMGPLPVNAAVTIYDSHQNPVNNATLIRQDGGNYVVQLPNAQMNSTYYIKVLASNPGLLPATGAYGLSVDFSTAPEAFTSLSNGNFKLAGFGSASSTAQNNTTLTEGNDSLVNFLLAASTGDLNKPQGDAGVMMTVTDANGNVVANLATLAGNAQSTQVWLKAGTYTISYTATNYSLSKIAALNWSLFDEDLSDTIRVYGASSAGTSPTR